MRHSYLAAVFVASGLLLAAPAFAQSAAPTTTAQQPAKPATQVKKQHTDGEDVTGNNNFPAASSGLKKQRADGEDVTGNNNFPAASK